MNYWNMLYKASIFANLNDIVPSPEIIIKLTDLLKSYSFIPSTFGEKITSSQKSNMRLLFTLPNNEWIIKFGTERMDIEKNALDSSGTNMGEIIDFMKTANELIETIFREFKKKGRRIALNTSIMLEEMSNTQLNSIYEIFINPIAFYKSNPPTQWATRSISRFEYKVNAIDEEVNIITDISRARGVFLDDSAGKAFDRIKIDFDVNTLDNNHDTRFFNVLEFLHQALESRNNIISDIERAIYER